MRSPTDLRKHPRGLSGNGTVVVVKEPRNAVLTTLAVPMSLGNRRLDWLKAADLHTRPELVNNSGHA